MRAIARRHFDFSYRGRVYAARAGDEIDVPDDLYKRHVDSGMFRATTPKAEPVAGPAAQPSAPVTPAVAAPSPNRRQQDRKRGR